MASDGAGDNGVDILPRSGRIIAVDWGRKRIGLAVSDPEQLVGTPLVTLVRRAGKRFPMKKFREIVDRTECVGFVVGHPLGSEGEETPSSQACRSLADEIRRNTSLPVILVDERFSTSQALKAVKHLGGSTRGRKQDVDRLAATVLLQTYLEQRRS